MVTSDKLRNLVAQWPIGFVVLGIALTALWIAIVLWVPLRLLISF
jgi:hypothetical protein